MSSSTLNTSEELDQIFNNYHYGTFEFDAWVENDSRNISNADNESYYYNTELPTIEPSHNQLCTIFVDYDDPDTITPITRCAECQVEMEDNKHGFTTCSKCTEAKKLKETFKGRVRNPRQRKTNQKNKKNQSELNAKPYQCKYCDEYFGSISTLLNHVKIHSDIHCSVCGQSFYTLSELQDHAKVHNSALMTSKRMRTKTELPSQNRKSKNEVYETAQTSTSHLTKTISSEVKIDTDKLYYTCNMCGKIYSKNSLHICMDGLPEEMSETEFKSEDSDSIFPQYKCSYCNDKFDHEVALEEHLVTHNVFYRFQCKFCDQRFQKSFLLLRHVQNVHNIVQ